MLAGLAAFACTGAEATPVKLPAPGPRDTCPVCGMFVAPYRYWIATVLFKDGQSVHFDGAKDLYKYLTDMARWAGGRKAPEIATIGVTSYYDTAMIDAANAVYVIGSDVLGPMGHELVPHETTEDAEEFLRDHKGKRMVKASDITATLLAALDDGRFE
ncbi:MAG: nitrous oxide reductase accessory protein NosL [Bradyrhizobium sp.]|nr:nitrous oxide reductase accessory protein NosL [Bradyrhizobium sp.]